MAYSRRADHDGVTTHARRFGLRRMRSRTDGEVTGRETKQESDSSRRLTPASWLRGTPTPRPPTSPDHPTIGEVAPPCRPLVTTPIHPSPERSTAAGHSCTPYHQRHRCRHSYFTAPPAPWMASSPSALQRATRARRSSRGPRASRESASHRGAARRVGCRRPGTPSGR